MVPAGGIVLAGGRSERMGTSKASLDWHGTTLLRRVASLVSRGVSGPVVVVRSPGQDLPALASGIEVTEDGAEALGPIAGLLAGLEALGDRVGCAFLAATDMPFLHPDVVRRVLSALGERRAAVVPVVGGREHPLAAAYRSSVRDVASATLAAGERRMAALVAALDPVRLSAAQLLADPLVATGDPDLCSVENLNTTAEYDAALRREQPAIRVVGPIGRSPLGPLVVRASTLAGVASAGGWSLPPSQVELNGAAVDADPELALAAGDEVRWP